MGASRWSWSLVVLVGVLAGTADLALARPATPAEVLVACLPRVGEVETACGRDEAALVAELVRRRPVPALVRALAGERDARRRALLVDVLYHVEGDRRVARAFEALLGDAPDAPSYFAAMYLAKAGSRRALRILHANYGRYPVSSEQWAYTVALFGKAGYRAATPELVSSLGAASLNVVDAAMASLRALFPCAPAEFASLEAAAAFFRTARCGGR